MSNEWARRSCSSLLSTGNSPLLTDSADLYHTRTEIALQSPMSIVHVGAMPTILLDLALQSFLITFVIGFSEIRQPDVLLSKRRVERIVLLSVQGRPTTMAGRERTAVGRVARDTASSRPEGRIDIRRQTAGHGNSRVWYREKLTCKSASISCLVTGQ